MTSAARQKFQVHTPGKKPPVDPQALERFASGAVVPQENLAPASPQPAHSTVDGKHGYFIRLTPDQFARAEYVYSQSKYKSKQQMGAALFMIAVEELAKQLGIK